MNEKKSLYRNYLPNPKMKGLKVISILVLFLISFSLVQADVVISNSRDWKDVYAVLLYGAMEDKTSHFIVAENHAPILLNEISINEPTIVYSGEAPYTRGYKTMMDNRGFVDVTEINTPNVGFELLNSELNHVNNFIILDQRYGYNAISIAPYALLTNSWVLFADRSNIREVSDILNSRPVDNIIIYGTVDRQVLTALESFNPEIINVDGDRYLTNLEIVKKFKEISDVKQVILTNGEFLERDFFTDVNPVIFIGTTNLPLSVRNYITNSNIKIGVLVGNELFQAAQMVKEQTKISTIIKFGRSARSGEGMVNQIEGLDLYKVPSPNPLISLLDISYNKATNSIYVTINSTGNIPVYVQGTYTLSVDGKLIVLPLEAEEPQFISDGETKTFIYPLKDQVIDDSRMYVDARILFGESKVAMQKVLEAKELLVNSIDIDDDSELEIMDVVYNKGKKGFDVKLFNPGRITTYASVEILDLSVNAELRTFGSEDVLRLGEGREGSIFVPVELFEEDFEFNPIVSIRAYYGKSPELRVKITERDLPLKSKRGISFNTDYILYGAAALVLLFIILSAKKKCPTCGEKNHRKKKHCPNCGTKLKH